MEFRILGPLWVGNGATELTPTAPKVRQVLALLLVRCGNLVQIDQLIDELWRDKPPSSAITTLQTYIYKIRKDVLTDGTFTRLHTRVSGYMLDVPAEHGDLLCYEQLTREGQKALDASDTARAADLLRKALALWRGPALADVAAGDTLSAHVTRLEEERKHTLELRISADLALGRHQQLVSELKMLAVEQPLNERLHAHLMTALYRSGRRHEALGVYQRLRRALVDELGIEPSGPVQQLHLNLLGSDSGAEDVPEAPTWERSTERPVPVHVPGHRTANASDFVGRHDALPWAHGHLTPADQGDPDAPRCPHPGCPVWAQQH